MDKEGMAGHMKHIRWEEFDLSKAVQDEVDGWEALMERFFIRHTVEELEEEAARVGIRLVGVKNVAQVIENPHLKARGFWEKLDRPGMENPLDYTGFLFLSNKTSSRARSHAPCIGEHNTEVYGELLSLSKAEIGKLKQEAVI
jgi:crotonobetainyl-CoA:carnitine CoA-transferase CaiB-like acyl-CoA transferase